MSDPTSRPLDLPAVIKALNDVPPERQPFVGVMIVLLVLLFVIAPVCLVRPLH